MNEIELTEKEEMLFNKLHDLSIKLMNLRNETINITYELQNLVENFEDYTQKGRRIEF